MSESLVLDRIYESLGRLRLTRIAEILEQILGSAESESKSYLSFLDELLQEEVAKREQRRIETALKISGLPFRKTIDEFDFTFQPKLDRQKIMSLLALWWFITNLAFYKKRNTTQLTERMLHSQL